MVTDGWAPYPAAEIIALNNLFATIQGNGCRICARCYFIKSGSSNTVPTNFQDMCDAIGADVISESEADFDEAFEADFKVFLGQSSTGKVSSNTKSA